MQREFDLVMFGATGFTGRLVADYIASATAEEAGRSPAATARSSRARLRRADRHRRRDGSRSLRGRRRAHEGRVHDRRPVHEVRQRARRRVRRCRDALLRSHRRGELHARDRSTRNHERAKQTGARIVHTCGFDSIPSDLGTWATQQEFIARFGTLRAQRSARYYGETERRHLGRHGRERVRDRRCGERPTRRPHPAQPVRARSRSEGPAPRPIDKRLVGWDSDLKMFFVPFFMAPTNGPVVRRGHALAGLSVGRRLLVSRGDVDAGQRARRRDGGRRSPAGSARSRPR